jgi:ABC-type dipeptide/oligopeptide/nickel transport system permease subunit
MKNARLKMAMNIQEFRTNEASNENHLIGDFAKHANAECEHVLGTERHGRIARRFDDVIFTISISLVLFLIASVIAIAFYTVT